MQNNLQELNEIICFLLCFQLIIVLQIRVKMEDDVTLTSTKMDSSAFVRVDTEEKLVNKDLVVSDQ